MGRGQRRRIWQTRNHMHFSSALLIVNRVRMQTLVYQILRFVIHYTGQRKHVCPSRLPAILHMLCDFSRFKMGSKKKKNGVQPNQLPSWERVSAESQALLQNLHLVSSTAPFLMKGTSFTCRFILYSASEKSL